LIEMEFNTDVADRVKEAYT